MIAIASTITSRPTKLTPALCACSQGVDAVATSALPAPPTAGPPPEEAVSHACHHLEP
jgi:hypothetical protein